MTLKIFIKELEKVSEKHGGDIEVIMADNMPVSDPVFSNKYPSQKNIVITDKNIPE